MGYEPMGGYGAAVVEHADYRFSPYGQAGPSNGSAAVIGYNSRGYPLRAGQSPCTFYLKTGDCKYGKDCRWDHPEGAGGAGVGVAGVNSAGLPLRPGETPCSFYLKTGQCKFGNTCKFDHPENGAAGGVVMSMSMTAGGGSNFNDLGYPLNPGATECAFYMKTGECKFGATCKFSHPSKGAGRGGCGGAGHGDEDELEAVVNAMSSPESADPFETMMRVAADGAAKAAGKGASGAGGGSAGLNSAGLPLRPGTKACAFFLKTGSCNYGAQCRWDHPEGGEDESAGSAPASPRIVVPPSTAPHLVPPSTAPQVVRPSTAPQVVPPVNAASQPWRPKTGGSEAAVGVNSAGLPMRPGATPCAFYVKTGQCKFGESCRFDHPEPTDAEDESSSRGAETGGNGFEGFEMSEGAEEIVADGYSEFFARRGDGSGSNSDGFGKGAGKFGISAEEIERGFGKGAGKFGISAEEIENGFGKGAGKFGISADDMENGIGKGAGKFGVLAEEIENGFGKGAGKFGKFPGGGSFGEKGGFGKAGKDSNGTSMNSLGFPIRPGQKPCAFYVKTGQCKYASTCIWDHPEPGSPAFADAMASVTPNGGMAAPGGPGLNELGYPLNPGAPECAFYMKTGTCKFGATCKFSHPSQGGAAAGMGPSGEVDPFEEALRLFSGAGDDPGGEFDGPAGDHPMAVGDGSPLNSNGLPMRPGQQPCSYFIRTATCKYGPTCRWDHPEGMGGSGIMPVSEGLPERPGEIPCAFYLKNGTCSFGATCRFDHPAGLGGTGAGSPGGGCGGCGGCGSSATHTANPPAGLNSKGFALRPGEPSCPFYMRSGHCMFGATCKFNHPEEGSFL